jgi:hypothetical protein
MCVFACQLLASACPSNSTGDMGCDLAGFLNISDTTPFPQNQITYVNEPFSVRDSASTGPAKCFELTIQGPDGGLIPGTFEAAASNSTGHVIAFTPRIAGRHCYSFKSLGGIAHFPPYEREHSACVDVRAPPMMAAPCLTLPQRCLHTATARAHFACDEALYAFDGGLVGFLADGGFFIGEGDVLTAYERGQISTITVSNKIEKDVPLPSIFPAHWAVAESLIVASDGDSGIKFSIDSGQLGRLETFSSIENQQVISVFNTGQVVQANQSFICTVNSSVCLHKSGGIISMNASGIEYCEGQFQKFPQRAVIDSDGGFAATGGSYPLCGSASLLSNSSLPRRRMLVPNAFGVSKVGLYSIAYSAPNVLAWYSSDTHIWSTSATQTTIWCE